MMRYEEAIARLFAMESRGIRLGVSRMHAALAHRGHPERGQRFVHVAGTNGKGSVAVMLSEILARAGYRTGLFTSPHLHRYVERVRIGGRPIGEREAATRIAQLLAAFARPGAPETTFFELTTLLAVEAFRERECDVAVMEVGLGGRLDATNALPSELTIITGVSHDHMGILGGSLTAIAREKAGILRRGTPAVLGVRHPEARRVVEARRRRLGAAASWVARDFGVEAGVRGAERVSVWVGARRYRELALGIAGPHQAHNAACAIAAVEHLRARGYEIADAALRAGLARARWPGRLERVVRDALYLFDAAHNVEGAHALAAFLRERDPWLRRRRRGRRVLLFGCMRDKDHAAMLEPLLPLFDRVYFRAPEVRRALPTHELARRYPGRATRGAGDALARARRSAGADGEIVVAGSIFLIGELRARVLGVRRDPLIRM